MTATQRERQRPIIDFPPIYDLKSGCQVGGALKFSVGKSLFENSLPGPMLAQPTRNRLAHTQNRRIRIVSKNFPVDLKVNSNWGRPIPAFRFPVHDTLTLPLYSSQVGAKTHAPQDRAIDIVRGVSNRILAYY